VILQFGMMVNFSFSASSFFYTKANTNFIVRDKVRFHFVFLGKCFSQYKKKKKKKSLLTSVSLNWGKNFSIRKSKNKLKRMVPDTAN